MRILSSAKAVLKAVSFMTTTDDGERRKEGRKEGRNIMGERDKKIKGSG